VLRFTEYKDYKNNIFLNDLTSISCSVYKNDKHTVCSLANIIAYMNYTFTKIYQLEYWLYAIFKKNIFISKGNYLSINHDEYKKVKNLYTDTFKVPITLTSKHQFLSVGFLYKYVMELFHKNIGVLFFFGFRFTLAKHRNLIYISLVK